MQLQEKRKLPVRQQMPWPMIIYEAHITNNISNEHKKLLDTDET